MAVPCDILIVPLDIVVVPCDIVVAPCDILVGSAFGASNLGHPKYFASPNACSFPNSWAAIGVYAFYQTLFIPLPGFGSTRAAMFHPGKHNGRLFHDQIILYGFDPLDAPCDLTRFIDGLLRINEAAQLNRALVSFDTDLE